MGKGKQGTKEQAVKQTSDKPLFQTNYEDEFKEENYKNIRFDEGYFGGQEEIDAIANRYKDETEVTEAEIQRLKENMPEKADFEIWSKAKYESKWFGAKYKYNKRVKKYLEKRRKWNADQDYEANKSGKNNFGGWKRTFVSTVAAIGKRAAAKKKLDYYKSKGYFKDIEENSEAMDEAYEQMEKDKEYQEAEKDIAISESALNPSIVSKYTSVGAGYGAINDYFRRGKKTQERQATQINEELKKIHLNRDIVVRRGVKGVNTIAHMLGLENPDSLTADEIKDKLKEKMSEKSEQLEDLIVTEKGFMSTSVPYAPRFFDAGDGEAIGIEFIILAKKGTNAADLSATINAVEGELLFNAGTKFKMVDAVFEDAKILHGSEKSWKIYLVSIPSQEEGIRRDSNDN